MSPKKRNQKLLGYVRVSRMKDDGISPDLQRAAIEAYALANGHEVLWLDPDLDESGKSLGRPAMKDALDRLARGEADGLIAARLDRLTRRVGDLGTLLDLAREQDWNLVAIDLGVDLTTSNGKMVANLLGTVAEWELDRRREGWKDASANAVIEKGIHVSSRVPAGYERVLLGHDAKGRAKRGPLVPSKDAPAVLAAFEARADGATWADTAKILTDAGVKKSRDTDDAVWSDIATAALCQNRVYLGEARGGGNVNPDAHPAIVSPGLFARVQARKNERGSFEKRAERELLAGLAYCASCGSRMRVNPRQLKDGRKHQNFVCPVGKKGGCSAPAGISSRKLEDIVFRALRDRSAELAVELPRSNDAAIKAAQIRLDNAQAQLDDFVATADLSQGSSTVLALIARLEGEVEEAAQALNETVAGTGTGDWVTPTEVPDEAIGLRLQADGDTIQGARIPLMILSENQFDNAKARRMLAQVVARVIVAAHVKGTDADERVTVDLV